MGIQIYKTAIELAEKHFGNKMTIFHGSHYPSHTR